MGDRDALLAELVTAEAEIKRLREALVAYADMDNWSVYRFHKRHPVRCWLGELDAWEPARKALEPAPAEEGRDE